MKVFKSLHKLSRVAPCLLVLGPILQRQTAIIVNTALAHLVACVSTRTLLLKLKEIDSNYRIVTYFVGGGITVNLTCFTGLNSADQVNLLTILP